MTSRIIRVLDGDWEKTAQACSEVERAWVWACYRSFGRDVAGKARFRPSEVLPLCALARPHGSERECVSGAAEATAANFKRRAGLCTLSSGAPRVQRPVLLADRDDRRAHRERPMERV